MCKESNDDDTKETLQNKQTKGTHESSVGVFVCVHMLQVCVHVKHVVVLVALRIRVIFLSSSMFPRIHFSPVCKFLVTVHTRHHLDHVRAWIYEIQDLSRSGRGSL